MSAGSYDAELAEALAAVRAAARVCRAVALQRADAQTLQKADASPVTVADFASQAVVCECLARAFPDDPVVGEEGSAELRAPARAPLREAIARAAATAFDGDAPAEADVLAWIDRGGAPGRSARFWTLDPIDGTRGFLRGAQYAIALALLEEQRVVAGVLACPNWPGANANANSDADANAGADADANASADANSNADTNADTKGALFAAVRGGGARRYALWDDADTRGAAVAVDGVRDPAVARFCESVEAEHSNQTQSALLAQKLGITRPPFRIDSQCKYAAVASADASIYLRLPARADYREKIWDHAAGMILVEEAGGRVTDAHGKALGFGHGRELRANTGVVASSGPLHDALIAALRDVL